MRLGILVRLLAAVVLTMTTVVPGTSHATDTGEVNNSLGDQSISEVIPYDNELDETGTDAATSERDSEIERATDDPSDRSSTDDSSINIDSVEINENREDREVVTDRPQDPLTANSESDLISEDFDANEDSANVASEMLTLAESGPVFNISGQVRDDSGIGIDSARVCLESACSYTDEYGHYSFYDIEGGDYWVTAYITYHPGEWYSRYAAERVSVSDDDLEVNFTFKRMEPGSGAISGTIRDDIGDPVIGATVYLEIEGVVYHSNTNESGFYSFDEVPNGRYFLSAMKDWVPGEWYMSMGAQSVDVAGEDATVDFTARRLWSDEMYGLVVDQNGSRLTGVHVVTGFAKATGTKTVDGKFGLTEFSTFIEAGGEKVLYFSAVGCISTVAGASPENPGPLNFGTITLQCDYEKSNAGEGPRTITGTILNQNGDGIPNAGISMYPLIWGADAIWDTSDSSGNFSLQGVSEYPSGMGIFSVTAENCQPYTFTFGDFSEEIMEDSPLTIELHCNLGDADDGSDGGGSDEDEDSGVGDSNGEDNDFAISHIIVQVLLDGDISVEGAEFGVYAPEASTLPSGAFFTGVVGPNNVMTISNIIPGVYNLAIAPEDGDMIRFSITVEEDTTSLIIDLRTSDQGVDAPATDPSEESEEASAGSTATGVSGLPSTGSGSATSGLVALASAGILLLASAAAITRLGISRR